MNQTTKRKAPSGRAVLTRTTRKYTLYNICFANFRGGEGRTPRTPPLNPPLVIYEKNMLISLKDLVTLTQTVIGQDLRHIALLVASLVVVRNWSLA
jgi:hypothetical protein